MNIANIFKNYKDLSYEEIVDIDPRYVDYVIYSGIGGAELSRELRKLRKYEFQGPVTTRLRLFLSKYFDKMDGYKKQLKLDKLSYYTLEFGKEFISFLFFLRKTDPALTGIWFDYLFRYILDYPNFDDHRMVKLVKDFADEDKCESEIINDIIDNSVPLNSSEKPISEPSDICSNDKIDCNDENRSEIGCDKNNSESDDVSSDGSSWTLHDRIDLDPEERETFKINFLAAFNKNLEKKRLTAVEIFDLCLAHPIWFGNPIRKAPSVREKVMLYDPKFDLELERFKSVWPTINTNPGYNYEEYFEGDGDLALENEIIEIKLINRPPDNFVIFQLLTYAAMSQNDIIYVNSFQPLSNRIYQWDITQISKEERKRWLDRLNTGEF